ncbi:hypothetical protein RFN28_05365 [Mesorhizobium sp. VK24D]|uniref:Uncharacterized protein n=1 Tax=Mesorhizobium album TaxID=3072314 RepID=A0ABU4XT71_9HYPH|nr:hypothetical protein [Mesorhizobium sp. VK24D]MDX8477911.1 hypothetical protein [Mesorhizobium sp. VK24D]
MERASRSVAATFHGLVLAVFLPTTMARADWQFTRWGQSPDEVLKSSKIALSQTTPEEQAGHAIPLIRGAALLNGIYAAPEFKAPVWLYFADDRLSGVYLEIADGETASLVGGRLSNQYGAPAEKNSSTLGDCNFSTKTWNDAHRGNRVHFSWNVCESGFHNFVLIYTPIEQPDNGL